MVAMMNILVAFVLGIALLTPSAEAQCTLCFNEGAFDPLAVSSGVPCSSLAIAASQIPSETDPNCRELQLLGFFDCGCAIAPVIDGETCHVCGDDTISFNEEKSIEIFQAIGQTCGELNTRAETTPAAAGCGTFTAFGPWCECVGQPIICPLCPDGSSVPDPNKTLAGVSEETFTCGFIEASAALIDEEDTEDCVDLQRFAVACDCPNVEPTCTLCPLGESVSTGGTLVPGTGGLDCEALESLAFGFDAEDCPDLELIGVVFCGCEVDPDGPVGTCGTTLCPGGEVIPLPDAEVYSGVTCTDLEQAISLATGEETCSFYEFVAVSVCGCSGMAPTCTLCEDGTLPDSSIELGGLGSCIDIAAFFGDATSTECTAAQATAGVYCGCGNPLASQGSCRICGGETLLPEPGRDIQYLGASTTCGELELQVASGDGVCAAVQAGAGPLCCDGTPAPSSGATDAPTVTPLMPTTPPPTELPVTLSASPSVMPIMSSSPTGMPVMGSLSPTVTPVVASSAPSEAPVAPAIPPTGMPTEAPPTSAGVTVNWTTLATIATMAMVAFIG